ncbi:MAG: flagellar biosynthetic protein FliR, partial [Alphaproteobacteria bacterium]
MPGPLADFLAAQAWIAFIVFARVGAAFAVLPGFAEASVPARVRLLVAIAVTVVIAPSVAVQMLSSIAEPSSNTVSRCFACAPWNASLRSLVHGTASA